MQPQTVNVHLFKKIENKFQMAIFLKCTLVNQY